MGIGAGDIFGVREDEWKYAYDATNGRESLFNLNLDPFEQRDLAAAEKARARELRRRVAAWVTFEDAFLNGREN
jgi:arylsulfatase A-like enzyme